MKKNICLLFVLFFVLEVGIFSAPLKNDIMLSLREKQIQDLSLTGLSLVFYVNISNLSSRPYTLSGYNYRFMVQETEYLRLQMPMEEGLRINAAAEVLIALPVKITYEHLFKAVNGVSDEVKAGCYLMGELLFSDGKKQRGGLPIAFSWEFPIFKRPEIELLTLETHDLTIGGADLSFEAKIKNKNGFDLIIDRISYSLALEGHKIDQGNIGGNKNIDQKGDKVFPLRILLNFFEVSKELHSRLQESVVLCQFSGEIEVKTAWGKTLISFDKSKRIPISRSPLSFVR
ncbi:LEA type 2 family protein [Acidobacteriota bacterium]